MQKKLPPNTTLIGIVAGILVVAWGIKEAGRPDLFINLPSFLIIVGGTVCFIVAAFPPGRLKTLGKVLFKAFERVSYDFEEDIATIVSLAEKVRREGILSLEDFANECEDDFFKKGLMLVLDGFASDSIRSFMRAEIAMAHKRHKKSAGMVNMIASTAPALGLLGTYVGLIPMLCNLDDPEGLGPLMALELVSSFYGAFIAYILFSPLAKRLTLMAEDEAARKELLLEGILAIETNQNPRMIREYLMAFLTTKDPARSDRSRRLSSGDSKVVGYDEKEKRGA